MNRFRQVVFPAIIAGLLALPAHAQTGTGATPDDAKEGVGKEFDPAQPALTIPKPDDRFTNNPALNNLISPVEKTAPPLAEQEKAAIEKDYRESQTLPPEEKNKELKDKQRSLKGRRQGASGGSLAPRQFWKNKEKKEAVNPLNRMHKKDNQSASEATPTATAETEKKPASLISGPQPDNTYPPPPLKDETATPTAQKFTPKFHNNSGENTFQARFPKREPRAPLVFHGSKSSSNASGARFGGKQQDEEDKPEIDKATPSQRQAEELFEELNQ